MPLTENDIEEFDFITLGPGHGNLVFGDNLCDDHDIECFDDDYYPPDLDHQVSIDIIKYGESSQINEFEFISTS